MTTQIFNIVNLSGVFLALFATAEYLYHQFKLQAESTRKIVHIGGGLLALSFPFFFDNPVPVFLLCGGFLLLLTLSKKFGFLPSINAIDRKSAGSFLFPIAVAGSFYVATLVGIPALFYLPLLIMAICDPIACLVGKRYPILPYQLGKACKTLAGSAAFFLSAFFISSGFLYFTGNGLLLNPLETAFYLAITTTLAEGVSGKGFDNITIPLTAALVLYLL